MALLFSTDQISAVDATAVGTAMADRVRDDVTVHPAWDLVEEFTNTAVRWYVFKCLASISGLPNDFYVIMGRVIANGQVNFYIAEGYNSSTHTMSKYRTLMFTDTNSFDADGHEASTYALGAAIPGNVTGNPMGNNWTPSGNSTKWWIIAAEDGLTVAMNGAANFFVHCGAFIPLSLLDWPEPIMMIGSDGNGGVCSNPAVASLTNTYQNCLKILGGQGPLGFSIEGIPLGFPGSLLYNDKHQGVNRPIAELGIVMGSTGGGHTNYAEVYGWAAGKQKRMRYSPGNAMPAGMAFGDAFALSGRLWIPAHPGDTRIFDTGVASA